MINKTNIDMALGYMVGRGEIKPAETAQLQQAFEKAITERPELGNLGPIELANAVFPGVFASPDQVNHAKNRFAAALRALDPKATARQVTADAFRAMGAAVAQPEVKRFSDMVRDQSPFCGDIVHVYPKGEIPGMNAVDVTDFEKSDAHVHFQFAMIYEALEGNVTLATQDVNTGKVTIRELEKGDHVRMPPGTAYRVVRGSKPNRVRATCSPEYVDGDSAAWPDLDAWVAKNYPNG